MDSQKTLYILVRGWISKDDKIARLRGDRNGEFGPEFIRLIEAIPGADFVTLPATGHMMMLEAADGTLAALKPVV